MSWTDADQDAPRPQWRDVTRSHEQVRYEPFTVDDPRVTAVLEAIRETHVNGGALLAGFRVVDDEVIRWFASRGRLEEYDFLRHFLGSPAVRETLPELLVPEPLGRELGFEQTRSGTLGLDGEIATKLVQGGAYVRFPGTAVEAKRLAMGFVDALVDGRHEDFRVYRSWTAWTPWFADIAWDLTWVLVDARNAVAFLLCTTDTD